MLKGVLFWSISFYNSTQSIKPKFCVNCKFYSSTTGYCLKYPKEQDNKADYLVLGKEIEKEKEYYYCTTSRKFEHMCGETGKEYVRKRKNNP